MKKYLLLALLAICTLTINAQKSSLTQKERIFINGLKSFLSQEGFQAKIDEDDDLTFKKEGDTYWFTVTEEKDNNYYYVSLTTSMNCKGTNLAAVRKACNQINSEYKLAKAYITKDETSVFYKITGFYVSPKDVSKYFYRYMDILGDIDDDLRDYYNEYK